jgi:hypothetical protein
MDMRSASIVPFGMDFAGSCDNQQPNNAFHFVLNLQVSVQHLGLGIKFFSKKLVNQPKLFYWFQNILTCPEISPIEDKYSFKYLLSSLDSRNNFIWQSFSKWSVYSMPILSMLCFYMSIFYKIFAQLLWRIKNWTKLHKSKQKK